MPKQNGREEAGAWRRLLFSKMILCAEQSSRNKQKCRPKKSHLVFCDQWFEDGGYFNPNIYGLLMGTGAIIALGLLVFGLKSNVRSLESRNVRAMSWLNGLPWVCVAGLCGFGLLKSYSRGAWLGTACALAFLFWKWLKETLTSNENIISPRNRLALWFYANRLPFSFILAAVLVLAFWQFRHTELPVVRRAFSIGNVNDFSWRNRVTSWHGAVRMMMDKPLAGFGWGKAEDAYRDKYRAARLEETSAIQMNDYLMLGICAGVPGVLCLLGYVGLSFTRTSEPGTLNSELKTVCHAGLLILLVGFWFDSGLFKLSTGALFWALIGLAQRGSQLNVQALDACAKISVKGSIALRWLATALAFLAVGQTVLHLILPQLTVGPRTLEIARKHLVQAKAQQDFEFLASNPVWAGKQLHTLLEHVKLANYNRELVNWKLDGQIYREFVLSPEIDAAYDGSLQWRRHLWEHFYPRIRKEQSLETAAEIIARRLREHVSITETPNDSMDIESIWLGQACDARGLERITVAAMRSAGVPARISEQTRAEFWTGSAWKLAPWLAFDISLNDTTERFRCFRVYHRE